MKKPLKTSAREGLPHIAMLLVGVILASCATSPGPRKTPGHHPTSITPVNQRNWVQVSSHPSVWYPRGVPTDVATDHHNGEWVFSGGDRDFRYFIPLRGISSSKRQELIKEAVQNKAPEIKPSATKSIATYVAVMPVAVALCPLAYAGMIYTPWYFRRESENPALRR